MIYKIWTVLTEDTEFSIFEIHQLVQEKHPQQNNTYDRQQFRLNLPIQYFQVKLKILVVPMVNKEPEIHNNSKYYFRSLLILKCSYLH